MGIKFFSSLTKKNILSNKQIYLPFAIASTVCTLMLFMISSLVSNEFVRTRNQTLTSLFGFGTFIVALFSFIFIIYANSFVIKRRKKEIGLYAILGLEKKHISIVLIIELFSIFILSTAIGLILGSVVQELLFMILNNIMNMPVKMVSSFTKGNVMFTASMFLFYYIAALIYNLTSIHLLNPVTLLKGHSVGEKKPKGSLIILLFSLATLGAGYYISLTMDSPISSLPAFFIAVLLVIIGTYTLFISGSLYIMQTLKKNRKFYYRPENFISLSGIMSRIKQNAVGLANISILSTMIIISVSTTLALYAGTENILNLRFLDNNKFEFEYEKTDSNKLVEDIDNIVANHNLNITDFKHNRSFYMFGNITSGKIINNQSMDLKKGMPDMIRFISYDDYKKSYTNLEPLKANQVYIMESDKISKNQKQNNVKNRDSENSDNDKIIIGDQNFSVKPSLIKEDYDSKSMSHIVDIKTIILPDFETFQKTFSFYQKDTADTPGNLKIDETISFNTDGSEEQNKDLASELHRLANNNKIRYESRDGARQEWYEINGGFLFLGILLGLMFTVGAILLIYFKQISEGYDDRVQYQIMNKVGLDEVTVRNSIKRQTRFMFFMPLTISVIHTAFAFPILEKMLKMFMLSERNIVILSIVFIIVLFVLFYGLVYRMTARVYRNIVS